MIRFLLQVRALCVRDLLHFLRQRSRVIGAAGQPIVLWILLDAGFRHGMPDTGEAARYGTWLYPGVIVLIALFAAIFSTISVIDDRKSGFLQGVLAAPVSTAALLAGKMTAGAVLAMGQAVLFLLLLPLSDVAVSPAGLLLAIPALAVISMTLTGLGFVMAWRMKSTQGFHAVMNLLLIPAWVLSGAFFPVTAAAEWMQWIVRANPLFYINGLFRSAFLFGSGTADPGPDPVVALLVTLLLFVLVSVASIRTVRVTG